MAIHNFTPDIHQVMGSHRRTCRHIYSFGFKCAFIGWLIANSACTRAEESRDAAAGNTALGEFVSTALSPFWRASEISEPIFFIQGVGQERPTGKLLFKPTEVLSVRAATHETEFEPGKDFTVDSAAGTISLPIGSKIPVKSQDEL